jgi:hypothetical protein
VSSDLDDCCQHIEKVSIQVLAKAEVVAVKKVEAEQNTGGCY